MTDQSRRARSRYWAPISLLMALAFIVASCSSTPLSGGSDSDTGGGGTGGAPETADSFQVVAYQGEDALGGKEIDFTSVLGNGTPVVMNFWAAQCPPCRQEMPWFEAVSQQFEGEVLLVGVDIGPFIRLGTNEQGAQLLKDLDITYPAVYAVDDSPVRQFRVVSMPTTVFFDGDGKVTETHAGIMSQPQMEEAFAKLAEGAA